jgi:hypothetical protein
MAYNKSKNHPTTGIAGTLLRVAPEAAAVQKDLT